jgi:hypothetical protein
MLDEMRVNDEQLDISDIRQLESDDEIAHFFAKLRFDIDERTKTNRCTMRCSTATRPRKHGRGRCRYCGKSSLSCTSASYVRMIKV